MKISQSEHFKDLKQLIGKIIIIDDVEWRISEIINRSATLIRESPEGEIHTKHLPIAEITYYLNLMPEN